MKDKKGFTLIELIAVLVILAILALIVTPLVLNIVRKAKDSANKRSIDAYGKAVDLAIATYLLDNGDFPTSIEELTIEYTGSEVVCRIQQLNEDSSVYLSECKVGNSEVKDSGTDDGWYHYGKTSATVYQSYKIGDIITYNGMNFYVIADSDETQDSVTMLKAEPLTVDEVNTYGVGHINNDTDSSVGTAYNQDGYGAMAYYSSETCGYVNGSTITTGCTTDYEKSDIKYVVDVWAANKLKSSDLKEDSLGYKVRLITKDELMDNLGYELHGANTELADPNAEYTPNWVYNNNYWYWTMYPMNDSTSSIWGITDNNSISGLYGLDIYYYRHGNSDNMVVRPVVTFLKSAI